MVDLTLFCLMLYFVKSPVWLQRLFPQRVWKMHGQEKKIYLSFDDGPHPVHTLFILDYLLRYNAKATFFCIGRNVKMYPDVYQRILNEGHSVGNHTFNHLNGKKTNDKDYLEDVAAAGACTETNLFRPPYGRLTAFQAKLLMELNRPYKIIMWTVLSGDFDPGISKKRCLENVLLNTGKGSVVVFHDSDKAAEKMQYVLPLILETFSQKGYAFERIT